MRQAKKSTWIFIFTALITPLLITATARAADIEIRIPIQVFADVGAFSRTSGSTTSSGATSPATPERNGAFVGTLTLFASPQLGGQVRGLFELVSEFNTANTNIITVERSQIGYVFSDTATVWGGRFHSPFGFWNTAYHHGAQLQPGIARPVQLSGALPAHTVGLWLTGLFSAGNGKLTYDIYAGNSTRVTNGSIDPNHTAGDNQNKNVGFNLGYNAGGALSGLRVGVHGLTGKITECASIGTSGNCIISTLDTVIEKSKMKMLGAYTHYDDPNAELIAEYYRFQNTNLESLANPNYHAKSASGFVQVGMVLGDWIPFIRHEKTSYDPKDELFINLANGKNYNKNVFGVRYELNSNAVLKAELSQIHSRSAPALEDSEEVRVQYAIRF